MLDAFRLTKFYNYPAHAVSIFARVVNEQATLGRSLRSLTKGHFLGSGVSLKFNFAPGNDKQEYQLTYCFGGARSADDKIFQSWTVMSRLPMKFAWITIGYFYVLGRPRNAA